MPVAKTKLNAAEQLHQLQDAFNRQKEEIGTRLAPHALIGAQ
jgi:hypothetical protein